MERRISRVRVRPTGRLHKDGAPSRRSLRDGSVPPGGQSKAGGTGAHCAPLRGGSHAPSYCNSKWVEAAKRDNAFTRAARPEGERVIRKRERTSVLSLLCAVRPRTPAAAGVQRATAAQRRLLASRRPRSRPRCAGTPSPCRANTQGWRAEVVAPYGAVSHAQGGKGGMGGAGGLSRLPAPADEALGAGMFRPPCKARPFTPSAAFLQ